MVEKKLTAKQQRFCDEYLIDMNGTQAAIRAGYSKKTAYAIAIAFVQDIRRKRRMRLQSKT